MKERGNLRQIRGSHSDVTEFSGLLGYDAV